MNITKLENLRTCDTVFGKRVILPPEMDDAVLICVVVYVGGRQGFECSLLPHQLYLERVEALLEKYEIVRILAVNNIMGMEK
jgi:hypothetical protein